MIPAAAPFLFSVYGCEAEQSEREENRNTVLRVCSLAL